MILLPCHCVAIERTANPLNMEVWVHDAPIGAGAHHQGIRSQSWVFTLFQRKSRENMEYTSQLIFQLRTLRAPCSCQVVRAVFLSSLISIVSSVRAGRQIPRGFQTRELYCDSKLVHGRSTTSDTLMALRIIHHIHRTEQSQYSVPNAASLASFR